MMSLVMVMQQSNMKQSSNIHIKIEYNTVFCLFTSTLYVHCCQFVHFIIVSITSRSKFLHIHVISEPVMATNTSKSSS